MLVLPIFLSGAEPTLAQMIALIYPLEILFLFYLNEEQQWWKTTRKSAIMTSLAFTQLVSQVIAEENTGS